LEQIRDKLLDPIDVTPDGKQCIDASVDQSARGANVALVDDRFQCHTQACD
jgi:hypothetical protein